MKKYHLLQYVEGCSPRTKKFKTLKGLNQFVQDFQKKYGIDPCDGNWLDYSVTNITGDVQVYDPSVSLEE